MSTSNQRCAAATSRGYGCMNPAQDDSAFCPGHDARNLCYAPTRSGNLCQRRAHPDGGRCALHR